MAVILSVFLNIFMQKQPLKEKTVCPLQNKRCFLEHYRPDFENIDAAPSNNPWAQTVAFSISDLLYMHLHTHK